MEIRNIIVSRTDKIGDLVLSIPSFYMIKKMYPNSKLTVLVRNYNYDVVKNLSYIDEVIKIDDYDEESLENKIKDINADIFVALYSDERVAKLARVSKAKWRVGPFSKIESFFSYNKGLWQKRSKSIKNEAEYNLDLVRSIDLKLYEKNLEINTKIIYDKGHEKIAEDWLQLNNIDKFILIHPFSGGSAKNITDAQYSELIEKILEESKDYSVVISSSIQDKERAEKIKESLKFENVYVFANEGSLLNLAATIDKCKLFIGTSTGPTHIAGALGKNIIGIYPIKKTQSPLRWGVYGNKNVTYILPEGEKEEDYRTKDFISWGEKDINKILEIIRSL